MFVHWADPVVNLHAFIGYGRTLILKVMHHFSTFICRKIVLMFVKKREARDFFKSANAILQ